MMTTGGQIIQYPRKNAESILKQINEAIEKKIDCKIYYSKDGDNHRIHTIQADKKMIYITRSTLSQEHPILNFRDKIKVELAGKGLNGDGNADGNNIENKDSEGFEAIK